MLHDLSCIKSKRRSLLGDHTTCAVLQTKMYAWNVTHPLPTAATAAAAAVKIGASSLSSSSSSSLYIKRSCLPKRRSDDVVVTLDRRRFLPAFCPRLSRGSLFHLRIFRGDGFARENSADIRDSTRRPRRKLHADDERGVQSDGWWREKQTGKLRGRSLAVDWRASAYPTPLITGRHPLRPTARPPRRQTSAVILHRALIRASLRIATARAER